MPKKGSSAQCFFITPIGDSGSAVRKHADEMLNRYLRPVGEELCVQFVRGDESAEPGSILRQIVERLLQCSAAVADLTGFNPNVMYELAIAHSFRKPTVLLQRTTSNDRLPFDVVQERVIQFDPSLTEDRERALIELKTQLRACLDGSIDTPVSTALDLVHMQDQPDGKEMARVLETILREVRSIRVADALSEVLGLQSGVNPSSLVDLGREIEKLLEQVNRLEPLAEAESEHSISKILDDIRTSGRRIEEIARTLGPSNMQRMTGVLKAAQTLAGTEVAAGVADLARKAMKDLPWSK